MKDGKFKTHAEIYQVLLKGGKITYLTWPIGHYIHVKDDALVNQDGIECSNSFQAPRKWSVYEEPKLKKKVTLYNYTYESKSGIYETGFSTLGFDQFTVMSGGKLLKTESKEVEYDDV